MKTKTLLEAAYNIRVKKIKKLDGYISSNYKISADNEKYVLKVYDREKETVDFVRAENKAMAVFRNNPAFPQVIRNNKNKKLSFHDLATYRLLNFIPGEFLAETKHRDELFYSFGKFLGEMDKKLRNFKNYVIECRKFRWDLQHFQEIINPKVPQIRQAQKRKLVEYFIQQHRENVVSVFHRLPTQIIHNDANDWNVLTSGQQVTGIIDFGDICHTHRINELAIAVCYAIMEKENPIECALPILKGYHEIYPLQEIEADVLFWLVAARLCSSVCNSAEEKLRQPDNEYITISEKPAWNLLEKWATINPLFAQNQFRKTLGFAEKETISTKEKLNRRFQTVNPIFSISYKKPIYMHSAAFQYMFDKFGNRFLDAYNNIPHVGHSHPRVVEAGQKQMAQLNTNTRYLYDQLEAYTEQLLSHFPKKLNKVFLVNSGSAASDLAIRIARNYTGQHRIAALEHGYHGNTCSVIEISHYKFAGKGGKGANNAVHPLTMPDLFRLSESGNDAAVELIAQARAQIKSSPEPLAAFFAEPIVGCGGQVPLPENYLQEIYAEVRKQGALCVSDEVQTGFGRMGCNFWGFEMYDVVPDMVILGKPMGNGHPMGAVVTTDEIAESFRNGMEFFSSFGGNPVSCAIGKAVLDVIEAENLQQNAMEVGNYYQQQLKELAQQYSCIGDVRGSGLFIGAELIKNQETLEPDTELAGHIKNVLREQHVLISTDGPFNNVLKSKPPLCFSKENVDEVIEKMNGVLKKQAHKTSYILSHNL